ncbi:MAG: TraB/GumN family protein, partial [Bacteroidetes bacterium]|nr:TraB/GumN family protein [Bacteroidota bacterium]
MFLLIGGPSLPAQSLLWKIEGKDLPAPSYLFGTIHAICPADAVLGDAVLSAVDSTAQIALELDLDDERLLVEVGRLSFLPGDSTLKDLYTEEDFARLDRWIQDSVGVSIQPMLAFRPLWLVGLLMNKILGCKATSYEQLFMAIARKQGKEVIGIESPEEQMQAFSSIPLREQAAMVLEMVDHADSTRAEFQRLAEAYTRQDLDLLRTLV